ncbi:AMP-binding protein [Phenylobacterium sp.]|uniref:class I adenylate-forming enzyme family protein n=1 Tax=Phenylobacterium sp. TaxID=1871053 RepID=UPI0011F8215E|nr:AMP-binding protein [Phenylobacterium sp.]THD63306.1 MAG: long-chain fatty acid--CoA ligase [Phenylobacterium sp.]
MFDRYVAFRARLQPRASAVITPARAFSFADLDADVNRFAGALRALGVGPASGLVAAQNSDAYEELVLLLALARLGVASTPEYDAAADLRLGAEPLAQGRAFVRITQAWIDAAFAAEPFPVTSAQVAPEAIGRVLMSSGTTRTPRRVGLSWRMIDANVRNAAVTWCAGLSGRWMPRTGLDSMLGLMTCLTGWSVGAAITVGWELEDLPKTLEVLKPSFLTFTPAHLRELLAVTPPEFRPLPGLRILVGGSLLPRDLAQETRLRLTADLRIIYGSTECSAMAHADAALLEAAPGATGYPGPDVHVEIVGADGALLPAGQSGEVRIICERSAQEYIDDPEASAAAFREGGFHPGDIGHLRGDGLLVLEGRADDRMNLGGRKFMPGPLEEAALGCPGVLDAAVFAAPDEAGLDRCWLAVVQDEDFDRERLIAHLAAQSEGLPPFRFAWIAEIPRNAMGKVERNRLRAETMAALGLTPVE